MAMGRPPVRPAGLDACCCQAVRSAALASTHRPAAPLPADGVCACLLSRLGVPPGSCFCPASHAELEVKGVGAYTDWVLECKLGRARCINLSLASMGYQVRALQ